MNIAILMPLRIGYSGGVKTHLQAVVPRLVRMREVNRVAISVPVGLIDGIEHLGAEVLTVSRYDYYRRFRQMATLVNDGGFDVVLSITARFVHGIRSPIVAIAQNFEPLQSPT